MNEHIWDTFDSLFNTVHRQGRALAELETRVADLERRLQERAAAVNVVPQPKPVVEHIITEMPAERAA